MFWRDHAGPNAGGHELPERRPGLRVGSARSRVRLVPARQLAGMRLPLPRGDVQRTRDDHAAPLHRRPQGVQLLPLHPQFDAQVLDARRPGAGQVVKEPGRVAVGGAHARGLGAADRVEKPCRVAGYEQVLGAMDRNDQVATLRQFAEPRPFRRWPGREPWAARLVGILVARLVQAGQGAVGGPREHPPVPQERVCLIQRPERPVRREPAHERPFLSRRRQRLHAAILLLPAYAVMDREPRACALNPPPGRVRNSA